MTKEYIINFFKEHKEEFREKYGVVKIGLFGSYARDEARDDSDIDIAIEMDKDKKSLHTFLNFKREIEHLFNKKIDLGIETTFKPRVQKYIQKDIIYV